MTGPILLVEDDDTLREMMVQMLHAQDYRVVAVPLAEDGLAALAKLRPGVILLDLGMPAGKMRGEELLHRLREDPRWKWLPVIILSGLSDVVNPDVASGLGVRAVLQKPVPWATLLEALTGIA